MATFPEVAISVDFGQVRKPEVIDHYPFIGATELRHRVRELGIKIERIECGDRNSITDVPGVSVGQVSVVRGEGRLVPGKGPIRTAHTQLLVSHEGSNYDGRTKRPTHTTDDTHL